MFWKDRCKLGGYIDMCLKKDNWPNKLGLSEMTDSLYLLAPADRLMIKKGHSTETPPLFICYCHNSSTKNKNKLHSWYGVLSLSDTEKIRVQLHL